MRVNARKRLLLSGIAALLLATGTAHTETNVLGCFVRTYDKAHLAEHPDQLVTAVRLHIYHPPPDEARDATWMKMEVKVRGRNVILTTSGICRKGEPPDTWQRPHLKHLPPPDALWCGVECDGGGIGVASHGDHAMMYLGGIRMSVKSYSCGGESDEELLGNKDDHVFRLNRVNERDCAAPPGGAQAEQAARLPDEMLGAWCPDKTTPTKNGYHYYRVEDAEDCGNHGGYLISKESLEYHRFGLKGLCHLNKVKRIGRGDAAMYKVRGNCISKPSFVSKEDPEGRKTYEHTLHIKMQIIEGKLVFIENAGGQK